ncbi:MAG: nucleotidyltransferase [Veillonellaceae bacterium]|jgi:nucleotidyltransferase substrate binding protein (TIGR01987 family)|nr:nucleotidyltransferase [Veillonellaceae bacterium]
METKKEELTFLINRLNKALATLDEVLEEPFSVIVRDATIQRFEYCFELSWKLLKKALKIEGIDVNSPRQVIRSSFELGFIDDIDIWFEMLEDRNMTAHTYNPDIADKVYESAKRLPEEIRNILKRL